MNNPLIRRSEQLYSFLLKLYPKQYRQEFGEEMKYVFTQSLRDSYREYGEGGLFLIWTRTISDALKSLVAQHIENKRGGEFMKSKKADLINQNKVFLWIAAATGLILLIPLLGMQMSSEWDWNFSDFVIAGTLLFSMGTVFVLIARRVKKKYRLAVGVAVFVALLLIYVHLAVGIVDSWPLAGS